MNQIDDKLLSIVAASSSLSERLEGILISAQEKDDNELIRLNQWCQVVAEGNWDKFKQRLSWDELNLEKLSSILGKMLLTNNILPSWCKTLKQVIEISSGLSFDKIKNTIEDGSKILDAQNPVAFQEIFVPFVYVARDQVSVHTQSSYHLLSRQAHVSLERSLLKRLSSICESTLELEFAIFKVFHQSVISRISNNLKRNSTDDDNYSQAIYRGFINQILEGGLTSLFEKYPVMAKLLGTITNFWVEATQEFLLRLESDLTEIEEKIYLAEGVGQVCTILNDISDYHNSGRSVIIMKFSSGFKLVYKPRNITIEKVYFDFLDWLNKQSILLPFKVLKVIDKSTYGWVEFVNYSSCQTKEEVCNYYERVGILLCWLYLLESTDLHHENLIASGEHPVLIDMETLMHPWVEEITEKNEYTENQDFLAYQKLRSSVIRIGLLPRWHFELEEGKSFDVTGLGGFGQQESLGKVSQWNNINSDAMTLSYVYKTKKTHSNIPFLSKTPQLPNDYIEEIVGGFRKMYSVLLKKRTEILEPKNPFNHFSKQQVRFVFRATRTYGAILRKILHPKYMLNGIDRSIQLDVLRKEALLLYSEKPFFWEIIKYELSALEQHDIPSFIVFSNKKDLIFHDQKIIKDCFPCSSFYRISERLKHMNLEDLEEQIAFVRGAIYSRIANDIHSLSTKASVINSESSNTITKEVILNHCHTIVKKFLKLTFSSNNELNILISPQYIHQAKRYQLQPINENLYEGKCGIFLFLAIQKKIFCSYDFTNIINDSLEFVGEDLPKFIVNTISLGCGVGYSSIIYSLLQIYKITGNTIYLHKAKEISVLINKDTVLSSGQVDLIFGAAGAILGLLALHNISLDSEALEKAVFCGTHLLNKLVVSESGYRTWATLDGKLLTGFSHGAAGIAYALLRLYKATGETLFKEAAEEAIAYERSVFIPELNNWPDFREPQTKNNPKCMCSWCHGAPGIGLARVATLDILDTPEIRQDIEAAITTTLNYGLSDIDHLCCGNMGRVEFLFTAGRKLNRPELVEAAMKLASQVVARAEEKGHYGYGPILDFHPGFFQGASGIGYQLLRLAYPDQLPSVLLWE